MSSAKPLGVSMVFCDVCLHKTNLQELLVAPRVFLKDLDDSLPRKTTVRSDFQGQVGKDVQIHPNPEILKNLWERNRPHAVHQLR